MTRILDLDELQTEAPEVVIKLNGKEHAMKVLSVGEFIENAKELEKSKLEVASPDEEGALTSLAGSFESIIQMILKAFPTMTRDMLADRPIAQLNQILSFVNGEGLKDAEDGEGNG
jgi:hypothetical protein